MSEPGIPPAPLSAPQFTAEEAKQARRLSYVLALVTVFFGLELTGAVLARSAVLKADAIHLLMDILALALSLFAMRIAVRKPTERFTFGLRRAEPMAALVNAVLVLIAVIEIVHDGFEHLGSEEAPAANLMLWVSLGALVVNGLSAWLLHDVIGHHGHGHDHGDGHDHGHDHGHSHDHGHEHGHGHSREHDHAHDHGHGHGPHDHAHGHDSHGHAHGAAPAPGRGPAPAKESLPKRGGGHQLNLRGARLHIIGDTLGSLAALVAALVIRFGGPKSIDPIMSFVVAAILLVGVARLLRDAGLVLFESAPKHLPVDLVRTLTLAVPGVDSIHALHVWTLGAGHDAVMVHVLSKAPSPDLAVRVSMKLKSTLGCEYVSVQVEPDGARAALACDA